MDYERTAVVAVDSPLLRFNWNEPPLSCRSPFRDPSVQLPPYRKSASPDRRISGLHSTQYAKTGIWGHVRPDLQIAGIRRERVPVDDSHR